MQIKKYGGKVYGANLTASEKKAMDLEIRRQLAEYEKGHMYEIDAMILWLLHEEFGFGKKRLKKFFDLFDKSSRELVKQYELENSDRIWICTYMLKQYGIDIEKWENEKN